jgi:integrase
VKLKGLNTRQNKAGVWYVSLRSNGTLLGKAPDRATLQKLMDTPAFLSAYANAQQKKERSYAAGTFGALVARYQKSQDWLSLAPRTRSDYQGALNFLETAYTYNAAEIELADVVELRDQAAEERNAKFSDFIIAVMSAVFRFGCEAGLMKTNPARGVRRLYKASADANRRWSTEEWQTAYRLAPANLRTVLLIARHCGLRGQDIAALTWDNYRDDPDMGKVLAFVPKKNGNKVGELTIGVPEALRSVLDAMKAGDGVVQPASNAPICRNSLGKKYPTENAMRKAWQDMKASKAFEAAFKSNVLTEDGDDTGVLVARELTLHGLRVTFSSELREQGFSDREVADMLGDLSEGMGKRYSRGAQMRKTSVRVHQKRAV